MDILRYWKFLDRQWVVLFYFNKAGQIETKVERGKEFFEIAKQETTELRNSKWSFVAMFPKKGQAEMFAYTVADKLRREEWEIHKARACSK